MRHPSSAQRLAASEVLPREFLGWVRSIRGVLNALRHLRFYHHGEFICDHKGELVLNALRHLRFYHSIDLFARCPVCSCSTPCGI